MTKVPDRRKMHVDGARLGRKQRPSPIFFFDIVTARRATERISRNILPLPNFYDIVADVLPIRYDCFYIFFTCTLVHFGLQKRARNCTLVLLDACSAAAAVRSAATCTNPASLALQPCLLVQN